MTFWKRYGAYFLGATLVYIAAFGINFIGGDSNIEARTAWALVWGTLMWPFFIIPQVFLQWVVRKLFGPRLENSFSKQLLVTNFPVVMLVVCLLGYQYAVSSPTRKFKDLVVNPIPETVRSIQQGGSRAMDSLFWVLRFEISRPDLERLLDGLRFVPVGEEELKRWDQSTKRYISISKEDYLKRWESRIADYAKLSVNFSMNCQVYFVKEGKRDKYLFCNPRDSEAVFAVEIH